MGNKWDKLNKKLKYMSDKWDKLNKELDDALEEEFGSEEPKQETLEEAAKKRYIEGVYVINGIDICNASKECFIEGAKYQSERMYSEAIEFAEWIRIKDFQTTSKNNWIGLDMRYYTTEELFEQFKKK
jgi:hypothetical protein